ncbi:M48 family metalloprotease [Pedobacter hiemivivus]|uniref:Uncharacterized protein n=1 Tax=Pedobacter hiemivivus TaxID=2530454 RepID=A0A4R0NDP7_9SPHI|nr:hypothetical protein [Pedobacter hiemivivus]TCC97202.1 hypothetical protein EZ444_10150 [Pedobacter hiemivivus]
MIRAGSYVRRKTFFEPLVKFSSEDPNYINIENHLDDFLSKDDEISIKQKDLFFKNLSNLHQIYKNRSDVDIRIPVYVFTPMWILFGCFMFYLTFIQDTVDGEFNMLSLLGLVIIARCIYVVFNLISGFGDLEDYRTNLLNRSLKLSKTQYPEIWAPILSASDRIGQEHRKIVVLYRQENHCVPTITDLKRMGVPWIILTIPRNLLILSKQNPELYGAIIAHEISHIDQSDSGIWMTYYLDEKCAFGVYEIIMNLIEGKYKRLRRQYKIFNSSAEYLADLGAFIITENTKIFDFLKGGYITSEEGSFHPSAETRISFLKAVLYKQLKLVTTPANKS